MKKILILLLFASVTTAQMNSDQEFLPENNKKDTSKADTRILPFAFYDNSLGMVFGGFGGVKGFAQRETFAKIGGIISTSKTYYGYLQIENFQLPFYPRVFIRPDIYIGKVNDVKLYLKQSEDESQSAGANESASGDCIKMKGYDQWYEFNVKYLLPIGYGRDNPIINPVFKNGMLVSGETGGTNWNPFKSGRTFFESKFFYRHMDLKNEAVIYNSKTLGVELALSHENMDYYFNPTQGSYKKFSYSIDWGAVSDDNKFQTLKFDYRLYIPLYDRNSNALPCVLALNFFTMDTPSWYDFDWVLTDDAKLIKRYHRPQLFVTANLGGEKKLRSFTRFRFYDKSLIYYSAEIRKVIGWNPFNYSELTKNIGIDFLQIVAFVDFGRVAPQWNIKILHEDMKWSAGGGLRLFLGGLIVRLDIAGGSEGVLTQMFVDQPF